MRDILWLAKNNKIILFLFHVSVSRPRRTVFSFPFSFWSCFVLTFLLFLCGHRSFVVLRFWYFFLCLVVLLWLHGREISLPNRCMLGCVISYDMRIWLLEYVVAVALCLGFGSRNSTQSRFSVPMWSKPNWTVLAPKKRNIGEFSEIHQSVREGWICCGLKYTLKIHYFINSFKIMNFSNAYEFLYFKKFMIEYNWNFMDF